MKKQLLWMTAGTFLAIIFCCQCARSAESGTSFLVSIAPEKVSYQKGEPVALVIGITYRGTKAIEVTHPLDYGGYTERVEMFSREAPIPRRLWTVEEAHNELAKRAKPYPRIRFEPNDRITRTNWYQCWPQIGLEDLPKGLVFPEAGEFFVRAKVGWNDATNSGVTNLTIKLNTSPSDQEAYDWLEKSGALCQLAYLWEYVGDPHEYRTQASKFKDLREKHSSSVYDAFLTRTYMSASNVLARGNALRFQDLLGEKPKASALPK